MENSKIEWTDHTFNPWSGCIKVSPGCQHCYAETLSNRWGKDVWGPGPKRQRTSAANWKKPLQWNKQAAKEGKRYKVFCASMADVFEDNPQLDPWRVDLLRLIQETPSLDWLLLTKRPEHVNRMIERATGFSEAEMWFHSAPHVWLGTSVESQEWAEKRIPELLKIPARIRFLSCEPLLGPVDLLGWLGGGYVTFNQGKLTPMNVPNKPIHWVIVGGESGHSARPMHPEWARSLRDQCQAAGVAFHFKQWGEFAPSSNYENDALRSIRSDSWEFVSPKGMTGANWADSVAMVRIGKHTAGRLLDGRTWDEFPEVSQ